MIFEFGLVWQALPNPALVHKMIFIALHKGREVLNTRQNTTCVNKLASFLWYCLYFIAAATCKNQDLNLNNQNFSFLLLKTKDKYICNVRNCAYHWQCLLLRASCCIANEPSLYLQSLQSKPSVKTCDWNTAAGLPNPAMKKFQKQEGAQK